MCGDRIARQLWRGLAEPLRAHQQDGPLTPPNAARRVSADARTVLGREGFAPPRESGAPLRPRAPFWQDGFATGGSGGMS